MSDESASAVENLDVPLDRDVFLRDLLRELSGTLEDVVGLEESEGFVSIVGRKIGDRINEDYKRALALPRLNRAQVAQVLVDLKRRIQGDFYVIEETDEKIVLGNRRCPFGDKVVGRPSLCMMTSNVFGVVAGDNLGYAKISLDQTIAQGSAGCRITVYLQPGPEPGREYFEP